MPVRARELLPDCDFWGGTATTVRLGPTDGHLDTSGLFAAAAREDSAPIDLQTGRNSSTSPPITQQEKLVTNQSTLLKKWRALRSAGSKRIDRINRIAKYYFS
jgi:hypothetical protein